MLMDAEHTPAPGSLFQGKAQVERGDQKCIKCHSRLSFPCMEFKNDKFYLKCINCGEEFEGQRESDKARFHRIMNVWNGN